MNYQSILDFMKQNTKCIVHFGADWCKPCNDLKRFLSTTNIPHIEVDVDRNPQLIDQLDISSVPVIWISSFNGQNIDYRFGFNQDIKNYILDFGNKK